MDSASKQFRLNQALSKAGICSRRQADQLIASGRVRVNGNPVRDFSTTVDPERDSLEVDGKPVQFKTFVYIAMYKPRGIVTTCADERGRTSVIDLLPAELSHLRPVGRLDMNSEGLLIVTNDGELTQKVTHPLFHLPKRYLVTVKGALRQRDLKQMSKGVPLADGPTLPAQARFVEQNDNETTFELTITEGRNRQIRRMCAHLGYQVTRLVRVGIGGLQLGQMVPGSWRYLSRGDMRKLES
jgi:23S rRNA pseudouridine2605 synthase